MATIHSIIFDWSGVISDDFTPTYETVMAIFAHYGVPRITVEQFREDFDIPPYSLYHKHGIHVPNSELDVLYDRYWREYKQAHSVDGHFLPPLYPDAREVLTWLSDHGYWLGIVSSHPPLEEEVIEQGFGNVFNAVRGNCKLKVPCIQDMVTTSKLDPQATVYVGDMPVDVRSGREAGVLTAAVSTGYKTVRELRAENPDFYFESLTQFRDWMGAAN